MEIICEDLVKELGSKYTLSTLMAKRSRELNNGAKILSSDVTGKSELIALREIAEGLVRVGAPQSASTEASDSDKGE